MTLMATGAILPDRVLDKTSVVVSEVIAAVAPNNIAIYAGDTVELYRQLEMVTGWQFLWNGVRDRNLLDSQFVGALLYTGTDIDAKGEFNRRTASEVTAFTDNDVIIGIGSGVTGDFKGAVMPLDSAFEQLIQAARESTLLKAA